MSPKFMQLTKIHLKLREAKLFELDKDLQGIFEGVEIPDLFDADLDTALFIQQVRCQKQSARRR